MVLQVSPKRESMIFGFFEDKNNLGVAFLKTFTLFWSQMFINLKEYRDYLICITDVPILVCLEATFE